MALREVAARFGIEVDSKKLDEADKKVGGFIAGLKKLAAVVAGGLVVRGIANFAGEIAQIGDRLDKSSIRLGISTDALQELGFAAGQSGATVEGLTTALLQLQDRAGDALVNSTGENAKAFQRMGIAIRGANGEVKSSDELLLDAAEKISGMGSATEQTTAAMNLFGRQGKELLPMLKEGRGGIEALRKEAQALGGGFSKDAVKASRNYTDALGRMGVVTQTLRGRIAVVLLPVLQKAVDAITKGAAKFLEFAKNSSIVETVLGGLAVAVGALAIKMALAFAPFIAAIAGFALLVLLVEDVVTLFRGGKSVVGDFIDSFAGQGAAQQWVRSVKDGISGIIQAFKDAIALKRLFDKAFAGKGLDKNDLETLNRVGAAVGLSRGDDMPTDRAATLRKQRQQAAKGGGLFIPKGETREQAQAATLEAMTFGPTSMPVPSAGAAAGPQVNQKNNFSFTVPPGTTHDQVQAVEAAVERVMDRARQAALGDLVSVVPK